MDRLKETIGNQIRTPYRAYRTPQWHENYIVVCRSVPLPAEPQGSKTLSFPLTKGEHECKLNVTTGLIIWKMKMITPSGTQHEDIQSRTIHDDQRGPNHIWPSQFKVTDLSTSIDNPESIQSGQIHIEQHGNVGNVKHISHSTLKKNHGIPVRPL